MKRARLRSRIGFVATKKTRKASPAKPHASVVIRKPMDANEWRERVLDLRVALGRLLREGDLGMVWSHEESLRAPRAIWLAREAIIALGGERGSHEGDDAQQAAKIVDTTLARLDAPYAARAIGLVESNAPANELLLAMREMPSFGGHPVTLDHVAHWLARSRGEVRTGKRGRPDVRPSGVVAALWLISNGLDPNDKNRTDQARIFMRDVRRHLRIQVKS